MAAAAASLHLDVDHPFVWFVGGYVASHALNVGATTLFHAAATRAARRGVAAPAVIADETSRRRAGMNVSSCVHSIFVALTSLWLIVRYGPIGPWTAPSLEDGAVAFSAGSVDPHFMRRILTVSLAYFVEDFIACMPDWTHHPEDVAHHVMGIVLTGSCLVSRDAAMLGQHILVTELSTPLLNVM